MKKEKSLDAITRSLINEIGVETPPSDFAQNVIKSITSKNTAHVIEYKPIISLKGWIFVGFIIAILFSVIIFGNFQNPEILSKIDLSSFNKLASINIFESIKIPKIFVLSFGLFTGFVLIQIFTIKNFFDKQIVPF